MPAARASYEADGPVRILTINRPEKRNAIDPATGRELNRHAKAFRDDDAARVLVVTGAGDEAFSAGADLVAWRAALQDGSADDLLHGDGPLGFTRTTDVGKPTIAAIDGHCVAGGMEVAAWCDLRVAGADSHFGLLERRWNIALIDGGTQRLPRILGLGRAMDLILTGRRFDAWEALEMGFVNRVVEPGQARERAVALARDIAAAPQDALLADRDAVLAGLGRPLEEGLALEAENANIYRDREVMARTREAIGRFERGER